MDVKSPIAIVSTRFTFPAFANAGERFQRGLADLTGHSLSAVNVHSRTTTGIVILTAEGDKVTLSMNTAVSAGSVTYTAQGVISGRVVQFQGRTTEAQVTRQQSLTVDGDLNEQEIQAIQQVVKQVHRVSRQAASGKLPAALEAGAQIQAGGPLAAVGVQIHVAQEVGLTISEQVQARGERDTRSHDSRASSQPTPSSDRAISRVTESSRGLSVGTFLNRLDDRIVKRIEDIRKLVEKFVTKVERQLNKLTKTIRHAEDSEGHPASVEEHRQSVEDRFEKLGKREENFASKLHDSLTRLDEAFDRAGLLTRGAPGVAGNVEPVVDTENRTSGSSRGSQSLPAHSDQPERNSTRPL